MAETVYILNQTAPASYKDISAQDAALSTEISLPAEFRVAEHFIQLHIYSPVGSRLLSVPDYRRSKELSDSASAGKKGTDALYIDPVADSIAYGFTNGDVTLNYNFLQSLLLSSFVIKEVSADRTEIKTIPTQENYNLAQEVSELKARFQQDIYFNELRLDFGNNNQVIAVNLDISEDGGLLLKLYENLPSNVGVKSVFNLVEEIADPIAYTVQSTFIPDAPRQNYLKGPNFNIDVDQSPSVSTEYLDYNELYSYPVTSSYHQTLTLLSGSGIRINVDYSDYNNFVHFSSAYERLANFKYKLDLVHTYEADKAATGSLSNAQTAVTQSNLRYDNLIKGVVSKFDEYEKYLYFESGSKSWPKSTTTKPYLNLPSSNGIATSWFNAQLATASLYDELNESRLSNSIPEFIRQDSSNAPFTLFLDMVSQHFDNLWLYAKGITDKYDADNRLGYGISRDLIEDTLRSFGVKLYNSNFSTANLASMLIGEWYDSGSEQINSFVTASNEPTPDSAILHETYKRVYHNLPHLLKTKGTERGLRALINTFGIPSGSLEIKTFGGVERPGVTPYFASAYPTGSKLRLNNTGSIVPGSTLSQYISIQKDDKKFTQDQHIVEAGFSPAYNIDNYILSNITGSFNIDHYIGDPRYLYTNEYSSDTNGNLYKIAESLLSGSNAYDVFDFIRLIKFFDNQLFKMVKDFIPARDVTTSGIIIKPHILNRSKVKSAQATWTRPEYTGSIDTAFTSGSDGGVIAQYSTAYTASIPGLLGTVIQPQNTEVEKINGELGGAVLDMYVTSLNEANVLKISPNDPLLVYTSSGSGQINPPAGEFYWRKGNVRGSGGSIAGIQVKYIYINEIGENGVNIENALTNLKPGDKITFTVKYDNQGESYTP